MQGKYFYIQENETYPFLRIPKTLYQSPQYKKLSSDCILLYGIMLDRVSLSRQNNWIDKQGRIFIYFTLDEIMTTFNCAREKAVKFLSLLVDFGLLEKKPQGQGKPNILYLKKFSF